MYKPALDVKDIMIAITIRLDSRGPRGVAVSSRRCAFLPSSQLAGGYVPCMTNTITNTKQPTKLPNGRWAYYLMTNTNTNTKQPTKLPMAGGHKNKKQ